MASKETDPARPDLEVLAQVAEDYYLKNRTQSQIAKKLKLSTATVSRLLSRAREAGVVRIQIIRPHARHGALEAALRQNGGLAEVVVVSQPADLADEDAARRYLGRVAAPHLDALIQPGAVVGIGRGRTLAALAEALHPFATPRQIQVVQLLGEYGPQPVPSRTSEITRAMAEAYAGASFYLNAPAQVEDKAVAAALRRAPGIGEVVAQYDRLDVALVGIGPVRGSPLEASQLLSAAQLAQLEAAGAVGEICGHYFDAAGRPVDDAYTGCAVGISWEQLRRCPRLVALAAGPGKGAALRALTRAGLLHGLVTDEATARHILAPAA